MKGLFYKYNVHKILGPLSKMFFEIACMAEFTKWREQNLQAPFNDFYSNDWSYKKRYKLYDYLYTSGLAAGPINYFEFGVRSGDSFLWWLNKNGHADTRFYGFDTFTGLPEGWLKFKAGDMSTEGQVPQVDDSRAQFVKGLFQDTLPGFLNQFKNDKRNVILLDADLYTSTLYVLTKMDSVLKPGDIILFDDFGVATEEFLAFRNYFAAYQRKYELVGAANNYFFAAFRIKE